MNKNQLIHEIAKDLRQLAKSIETFLQENPKEDNTKALEVTTETPLQKEESISIEEVRAVLAAKSQGGKQPEVKALIVKYGANKLTDLDTSCYKDLLKEAEVL